METILVTTLGWLALSVSGSFNHFLKFLNFPSQSSVVSSLLVTFIALFLGAGGKERIHLKPGLALWERPVKYSLTWPLFNITNQIIILQKMMWWKACLNSEKSNIFTLWIFFIFFLLTVSVDYLLTTLASGPNLMVNAGVLFTIVLCSRLFTLHTMTSKELALVWQRKTDLNK